MDEEAFVEFVDVSGLGPDVDNDGLPLDWEYLTKDFEDYNFIDPISPEGAALLPVIDDREGLLRDLESGAVDPDSVDVAVLWNVAPHLVDGGPADRADPNRCLDPDSPDPRVMERAEWEALGIPEPESEEELRAANALLALEDAAAIVRGLEEAEAEQARLDAKQARLMSGLVKVHARAGNPVARMEAPALAASEVAAALRIAQRTARARVEEARALADERMAPVLGAMEAGRLTRQRVAVLLDAAVPVPVSRLAEFASAAVKIAAPEDPDRVPTSATLGRKLRRLAEDYADEPLAARREKAMADRRVDVVPAGDGMCHVTALVPLEVGAVIDTRLTAIARALQAPDEHRTVNQLRADAFTDLLQGVGSSFSSSSGMPAVSTGPDSSALPAVPLGGVRLHLVLTAPESTLNEGGGGGAGSAPGELLGYGPIDPETTRRLAAQASVWSRLAVGGENGAPLSIGRIRYAPTAAMRRFLAHRDATCRFPGCDKPMGATEADHTVEWQDGGTTDVANLALLCPEHHRLKSMGLWQVSHFGGAGGAGGTADQPDGPRPEATRSDAAPAGSAVAGTSAPRPGTAAPPSMRPPGTLEWTGPSGRRYLTFPHEEAPPPF